MSRRKTKSFSPVLILAGLIILGGIVLFSGCSTAHKKLNADITGPRSSSTLRLCALAWQM
ncbi:MAG: hypothetical protein RRA35_08865 [Desulfomonilia bacterium]|nr:hypothetical protein [Desulfomonilia bacterium]